MSTAAEVGELVERYLDSVFEEHEHLLQDGDVMVFIREVLLRVITEDGIRSVSRDYLAQEARAYAREYLRDLDEEG